MVDKDQIWNIETLTNKVKTLEKQVLAFQTLFEKIQAALVVAPFIPGKIIADVGSMKSDSDVESNIQPYNSEVKFADAIADENELTGKYGDPEVFKDPRDWSGPSYKGKKFSECPPKYLIMLAKMLDWLAADNKEKGVLASTGRPKHIYQELDAKRARGWAKKKTEDKTENKTEDKILSIAVDEYNFDNESENSGYNDA